MINPVAPVRPLRPAEALRHSSDQIRRAAEILADITADTADLELPPPRPAPPVEKYSAASEATILKAQRSFVAGLRLAQERGDHIG
jgi:hypothetical protein